jgi:hypothetical protein
MAVPIFKARINPAMFRCAAEAEIIGRILAAFGELEYMTIDLSARVLDRRDAILRALYRIRTTSARIDAADAMMASAFFSAGLGDDYATMMRALRLSLRIRNQYAHCNWGDDQGPTQAGLFFADLRRSAEAITGFDHEWKHVSVPLLQQQEAHFVHAQDWLYYLDGELSRRTGRRPFLAFPRPIEQLPPPLHNPEALHLPPWLNEDQKAPYLARAQAAERGDPTPTPAHLAMEAKREAARARRRAAGQHSTSGKPEPSDQT